MHEWSLAEAIVSTVFSIAEKENLKEVREVHLRLGELQQIEVDVLKFALSQMKTGKLRNAKFTVRTIRAKFKCRLCGYAWTFKETKISDDVKESIHFIPEVARSYVRCPRCGSPDFEVTRGRGLWITRVKGVK